MTIKTYHKAGFLIIVYKCTDALPLYGGVPPTGAGWFFMLGWNFFPKDYKDLRILRIIPCVCILRANLKIILKSLNPRLIKEGAKLY